MVGDDPDAPHMARARAAILAHGGAERTNVFTRIQLALLWRGALARGAQHAGGNHPAAAMVFLPPVKNQLLEPHGHRAAAGADRQTPPRPQSAQHPRPRALPPRPSEIRDFIRGPYRSNWGRAFKAARCRAKTRRTPVPRRPAPPRDRPRRRFRHRAPERRGRPRRHLPRHGQQRHDVRCAWATRQAIRTPRSPGNRCAT
jgi:hypothetical protein